jgi:hypothetical protein
MSDFSLTKYWIRSPLQNGPCGFGVTARSLDDAFKIIRGCGYELPDDDDSMAIREGITFDELDQINVAPNIGPMAVRGLWYPFVDIGVPNWLKENIGP